MQFSITYNQFFRFAVLCFVVSIFSIKISAQNNSVKETLSIRSLHYKPDGNDFVLENGNRKFNRALYGSNTAFRVEAGDLPEFAMYMPGMGGNCKIGIVNGTQSKWITEADNIKTVYSGGKMLYIIKDKLLSEGVLKIEVVAQYSAEGMIVKMVTENVNEPVNIVVAYGAASGKKFSRDGDMGADPESSFYMQPDYCKDNIYSINNNSFQLQYGFTKPLSENERYEIQHKPLNVSAEKDKGKSIVGIFPNNAVLKTIDATDQQSPLSLISSQTKNAPVVIAKFSVDKNNSYFLLQSSTQLKNNYQQLADLFLKEDNSRKEIANRIILQTPDSFINPLGSALAMAADAIWEEPTFMHGAIAWRMRLPAWRGPYVADPLGWHDRARTHFTSYAASQITNIPAGKITPDTALHFARQAEKLGTAMFSNGYICRNPNGDIRPHHYDMNLVFIDALLNHFNYTGDTAYIKKMWSVIKLHLAWEKRNFDVDNDGLYDAYCCIWASDALEYMGGGVTHSSAYNYRANKVAAQLARLIGEDAKPYENEADHIFKAMQQQLWINENGWFAEFKDAMGLKLVHPSAGLWTVYHTVDEQASDDFKNYQMMRYVDKQIPHIPFSVKELPNENFHLLATTNWQPYTWSVNNVVLAENLNTALAYWQSNENDNAFKLWKSSLIECMYVGGSPANFSNISSYDVVRGELYRDFADAIGTTARTLTEGLFGIHPYLLNDSLVIKPGFPDDWKFAKLKLPDVSIDYKMNENVQHYSIEQNYSSMMKVYLRLKALKDDAVVTINGNAAQWHWVENAVGEPMIEVEIGKTKYYNVEVNWTGNDFEKVTIEDCVAGVENIITYKKATIIGLNDPQELFQSKLVSDKQLKFFVKENNGLHSFFIQLKQNRCTWFAPLSFEIVKPIEIKCTDVENTSKLNLIFINHSEKNQKVAIVLNEFSDLKSIRKDEIKSKDSLLVSFSSSNCFLGTNTVSVYDEDEKKNVLEFSNWNITTKPQNFETISLDKIFNDKVTQIFQNKYLTPRPQTSTLQIPWQGFGNWCYPLAETNIDDAGVRQKASSNNGIVQLKNIPFYTNAMANNNIAFTSQWDNYPKSIALNLSGKSSHAYLLMAGSTNHMQSRFVNAKIIVDYIDGSSDSLILINPINWYPIEQDYLDNGFAFTTNAPKPYRLSLKTGEFVRSFDKLFSIKGVTNRGIDGGAATVLDMPLNNQKELKQLQLIAVANEVVVGLMSLTLVR